jgi:hypothetical protein
MNAREYISHEVFAALMRVTSNIEIQKRCPVMFDRDYEKLAGVAHKVADILLKGKE